MESFHVLVVRCTPNDRRFRSLGYERVVVEEERPFPIFGNVGSVPSVVDHLTISVVESFGENVSVNERTTIRRIGIARSVIHVDEIELAVSVFDEIVPDDGSGTPIL
jgi:hypothetical protein